MVYDMSLFRRGMRSPRNIQPPPEFMAQVGDLIKGNAHEQNSAMVRALNGFEAAIYHKLEKIMHTLEETLAAVQAARTSDASIIALLVGIKKQLDSALGGALTPSQQMRVDAIFNEATAAKSEIDDAVKANSEGTTVGTGIATKTTVTSSTNPANAGDTITLSGGVSVDPTVTGQTVAPTGSITFFDGSNALGTANIDSTGVAALASTAFAGGNLAVGDHSIHASYSGDKVYAPSDSDEIVQTVLVGVGTADFSGIKSGVNATDPNRQGQSLNVT